MRVAPNIYLVGSGVQGCALTHDLETRLGPNALVFQLPAPPFPEAGTVATMTDYEHFLPYLTSDNLRFSYGALRGTALARSLSALGSLPASALTFVVLYTLNIHSAACNTLFVVALGIALMLTAAMLAGGCEQQDRTQSILHPTGIDALIISDMAWLLFGGGAVIFVGVMALLAFSLRQRQRVVSPVIWVIL